MNLNKATQKINASGALLVFPVKNATEPRSIWSELHPRTPMRWEWSDNANDMVWKMWQLMKKLSACEDVVYSKWYLGRATFFSRELFTALLKLKNLSPKKLMRTSTDVLDCLNDNSPLSTRDLKKLTELQGKDNESLFQKSLKELFINLKIVGFGEVDDGAFPSLAVGSTQVLYEDLWRESQKMDINIAQKTLNKYFLPQSKFRKFWDKNI